MGTRSSFAPAFWLLPGEKREAIYRLHAFCRAADDAVDDEPESPSAAARGLQRFRGAIEDVFAEREVRVTEARALAPYIRRFAMRREDFGALFDALDRDVEGPSIGDESDLVRYCEGVAGAPGRLALAIFECHEARAYGRALGVALQCTNILRDAREDFSRSRIYFPLEDLSELGLTSERLESAGRNGRDPEEAIARLLDRHRRRTAGWFEEADRLYAALPAASRRKLGSARGMQRIYHGLFDRLRVEPLLPRERVQISRIQVARSILSSWIEARLARD